MIYTVKRQIAPPIYALWSNNHATLNNTHILNTPLLYITFTLTTPLLDYYFYINWASINHAPINPAPFLIDRWVLPERSLVYTMERRLQGGRDYSPV